MKKEKLTALYDRLEKLKELDEEGNVYGGSTSIDADWYVLDDFLEQLPDMYEELPDWLTAYYQVYMWEYQAFYEGLTGYYANFYESTDYDSIQKTARYLFLRNATITHYLIRMNFLKAKNGLPNGLMRYTVKSYMQKNGLAITR